MSLADTPFITGMPISPPPPAHSNALPEEVEIFHENDELDDESEGNEGEYDVNSILEERLKTWRTCFHVDNDVEEHLLRQLVDYSILLDRARNEEERLLLDESLRAHHHWDESRRHDAIRIGVRLARNPELIASRLRQSKHGVEWLLARWQHLAEALERGEPWTDRERKLALDLTGLPADHRKPDHPIADPAALATREIRALIALRNGALVSLDAEARIASCYGSPLEPSRALQSVRRRRATLKRLFDQTRKLLRYNPPPATPRPQPQPQPPTPPRPAPTPATSTPVTPPVKKPATPAPKPSPPGLNRRARRAARRR